MEDGAAAASNALERAWRIQNDAAALGFDWPDVQGVFDKLEEEIQEVREALAQGRHEQARHEVGDLLFTVVNLARFVRANPSEELDRTNRRFETRFSMVQQELARTGKPLQECTLAELDRIWDAIKERGH
jgi:uncharacterized protein YabN with tetrapyrrole methylase and pyrophosphatase domain